MIAGHEAVSEGDIILGPQNVTDLEPAKRGTAMMFQSYALFPHLSVLDNVAFCPENARRRPGDAAQARRRTARAGGDDALCGAGCRPSSPAASSSAWRSPAR